MGPRRRGLLDPPFYERVVLVKCRFRLIHCFFVFVGLLLSHPSGSPPGAANGLMDERAYKPDHMHRRSVVCCSTSQFVDLDSEGSTYRLGATHSSIRALSPCGRIRGG